MTHLKSIVIPSPISISDTIKRKKDDRRERVLQILTHLKSIVIPSLISISDTIKRKKDDRRERVL